MYASDFREKARIALKGRWAKLSLLNCIVAPYMNTAIAAFYRRVDQGGEMAANKNAAQLPGFLWACRCPLPICCARRKCIK